MTSERPIPGGQMVERVYATGAAKRLDRAARRAGWIDPADASLTGPQTQVLIFALERSGWIAGAAEVAHLVSGVSAASAAIRRLVDLQLLSQSAPSAPAVLTETGRRRAEELRGS